MRLRRHSTKNKEKFELRRSWHIASAPLASIRNFPPIFSLLLKGRQNKSPTFSAVKGKTHKKRRKKYFKRSSGEERARKMRAVVRRKVLGKMDGDEDARVFVTLYSTW